MKELIRSYIEIVFLNCLGAFFLIFLGILLIRFTTNNPQKDPSSPIQGDIKGWGVFF